MNKKIYLLTGYNNFFGQTRKPWVSIDTDKLINHFKMQGINVIHLPVSSIYNQNIDIDNSIILYTFSQRENLRQYLKDIIYSLCQRNNISIPSLELLLCHENKGYQEIYKRKLGINQLPSYYFSSKREIVDYELSFPIVLKTLDGSNGKGVFLIKSREQLMRKIISIEKDTSFLTKIDLLRRRFLRTKKSFPGYSNFNSKKDYEEYKDYIKPEKCFVLQQFIPNLEYDFRVIILGEHYYVTKRLNRKGDFRASGAKRFTFDFNADNDLLDYAKALFVKLNTPCLALDIGVKDGSYYLFEYQALHFGINAIVRGNGFYYYSNEKWQFVKKRIDFEDELCNAYLTYLKLNNLI